MHRSSQKLISLLSFIVLFFIQSSALAQLKPITKKDILNEKLSGFTANLPSVLRWIDNERYIIMKDGKTYTANAKTGVEKEATPEEMAIRLDRVENRAMLSGKKLRVQLGTEDKTLLEDGTGLQNPQLSPDLKYVAYTRDGNLFSYDINQEKEIQLTSDGTIDILNGYASWVYYEEILGRASQYRAFWWSPNSKHIAYFRSDQTLVPTYLITDIDAKLNTVEERTKYPKVGEKNPEVKVGVVSPSGPGTVWFNMDQKQDQYYGMPYWKPDGKTLLVQWMNRLQDSLIVYEMDLTSGVKKPFYTEVQKTWINLDDNDRIRFVNDGKNMIIQSDKSGWMQLYNYDINGKFLNAITQPGYTVTDASLIDEKSKKIYFTAKGKENTARTDYYVVDFDGKKMKRLSFGDYDHRIMSISPNGNYFVTRYSNVGTPTQMALLDNTGQQKKYLGDSKGEKMKEFALAKTTFSRVKSDDGLFELPLKITWPANMQAGKKYPVLISIYGGPNAGTCWDTWNASTNQQWYAQEGLIQVVMDHRASGHFGKAGVNYMYHNLGYWEMKDYSTMVKWLIDSAQADASKVCITGFSYGGYLSSYALAYAPNVFTHAMAGGSVTDWRLYDSHYTERYMGTVANNPEGYRTGSVMTHIKNYKGVLQLVHGNIDDNVHLENSIALASALQDNKKDFEYMTYAGGRHGWGGNKRVHFENLKTNFIYKYLLEKPTPEEILLK
jgi:dipeptidyl-peptidase-4